MQTFEFEGRTTEEAIEQASRELNIPAEELEIDILEPGSAGIFGLVGGKKAKIKVTTEAQITPHEETETIEANHAESEPVETDSPDETELAFAKEVLENILSRIPVETTVHSQRVNGNIALNIRGDKSGLLIGRKGKTLDALQYIVNKIANKASEKKVRVVVDSEDYRKRQEESLVEMARDMGEKAKKTQKPVATDLLNPHERRIVHLALKPDEALNTKSKGDGLLKKVLIIPKK
ncbi:MAG: Jag N-terminal domain-containing protein [Deltaproteobacteria bacterium]|nr:Jag N-terminal domain-containing protein [Deltaproteobacteria bacterium]